MNTRIENWILLDGYHPYRLMGKIYNHPNPKVGIKDRSITSEIVGKRNGKIVTQNGTEYEMGAVHSAELELFPKTKEDLFESLDEV